MEACIELIGATFRNFSDGNAVQPLRNAMWLPDKSGLLGMMPAYTGDTKNMGIKVVSVFPGNHAKGLSSHQGVVLLFESETGEMYAIIDGDRVTAIRTAAASAVATKALAREDAKTLTILVQENRLCDTWNQYCWLEILLILRSGVDTRNTQEHLWIR